MRALNILFALLITVSSAFAEFTGLPENVVAHLDGIKKYPKAASIVLWCRDDYTVNSDGMQVYERHEFRYLPDEAARDNWGDPRVNYSAGNQKLDILTARTYTADGRQIDATPQNAYNPVVPDGMDLAPDFGDFRQMVITILGLENGCIAEFHYRLTTKKPTLPWFEGRCVLREEFPVMARDLKVTLPTGLALKYESSQGIPDPVISGLEYKWTIGEQRGYLATDLAGELELLPMISFTTATDWTQIRQELATRFSGALKDSVIVPASLHKRLNQPLDAEQHVDTVCTWVRERFNRLEFDHSGFRWNLRPLSRVLDSGYGNELELALLVCKLASTQEMDNVSVSPQVNRKSNLPSLSDWESPLLRVTSIFSPQSSYFRDPLLSRTELSSAGLAGNFVLRLWGDPDGESSLIQPIVKSPMDGNLPRFGLTVSFADLTADTVHGKGTLDVSGHWGAYEAIREGGAEEFLKAVVNVTGIKFSNVRVRDLAMTQAADFVVLDFEFSTTTLMDTADGYRILPLDMLDFARNFPHAPLGLPQREFAQKVDLPGMIELTINAPLPTKWQIADRPRDEDKTWGADKGHFFSAMTELTTAGERFLFRRSFTTQASWIESTDWTDVRGWLIESGDRPANCIVFSERPPAAAAK